MSPVEDGNVWIAPADDGLTDHCSCHGYRRSTGACRQATEELEMRWLDDLEVAEVFGGGGAGDCAARPIDSESWLHEQRFARLKYALQYAGNKSSGIPALAQISPEAAAHLFLVMRRGWDRYEYLEQCETDS